VVLKGRGGKTGLVSLSVSPFYLSEGEVSERAGGRSNGVYITGGAEILAAPS
jgi:hypothetical protein